MDYGAVNAKVKAMRGKLLRREDYSLLCCVKNVAEFGIALKTNPIYKNCLEDITELDVNREHLREHIEERIVVSLYEDYASIYGFISDFNIRKFLESYFLKNEIRLLKMLLCMVYDSHDISRFLPYLAGAAKRRTHRVNTAELKDAKTVTDFITLLEGTEFHSVLANVYNEKTTLFQMEVQLDLYYFFQLWKAKKLCLNETNRRVVKHLVGMEVDMQNIMWIFRLKSFYNVANSLIYTYLIPHHYRLSKGRLSRLVEAPNARELKEEIMAGPYGRVFTDFGHVEARFYHEMSARYKNAGLTWPDSLAATLGYLFLKELEIKNLISVMEGIRYGLDQEDILKRVIVNGKAEAF